jgi:hypothetical protein
MRLGTGHRSDCMDIWTTGIPLPWYMAGAITMPSSSQMVMTRWILGSMSSHTLAKNRARTTTSLRWWQKVMPSTDSVATLRTIYKMKTGFWYSDRYTLSITNKSWPLQWWCHIWWGGGVSTALITTPQFSGHLLLVRFSENFQSSCQQKISEYCRIKFIKETSQQNTFSQKQNQDHIPETEPETKNLSKSTENMSEEGMNEVSLSCDKIHRYWAVLQPGEELVTLQSDSAGKLPKKRQVVDYSLQGNKLANFSMLRFFVETYEVDYSASKSTQTSNSGAHAGNEVDDDSGHPQRGRQRNPHVYYLKKHPLFKSK